jgi:hypothetical protein
MPVDPNAVRRQAKAIAAQGKQNRSYDDCVVAGKALVARERQTKEEVKKYADVAVELLSADPELAAETMVSLFDSVLRVCADWEEAELDEGMDKFWRRCDELAIRIDMRE